METLTQRVGMRRADFRTRNDRGEHADALCERFHVPVVVCVPPVPVPVPVPVPLLVTVPVLVLVLVTMTIAIAIARDHRP
nr:hypothetical protein [Kofleriaceae bacterium]